MACKSVPEKPKALEDGPVVVAVDVPRRTTCKDRRMASMS